MSFTTATRSLLIYTVSKHPRKHSLFPILLCSNSRAFTSPPNLDPKFSREKNATSTQPLSASSFSSSSSSTASSHFTEPQKDVLSSMIRVDQAGEIGANWIYRGQHFVLGKDPVVGPMIQEMWDQEKKHLAKFDVLIAQHRVRPTALRPLWEAAGFMLGVGTALMGKEAAMACTEAVETVIGGHYDDQLRDLVKMGDGADIDEIRRTVKQFRDEELEHHDIAVQMDAKKAPFHDTLATIIGGGCKVAIWVAQRI